MSRRRDRAGDVVGPFALLAIVEERIFPRAALEMGQHLGIYAGPKQREVADMAMHLPLRLADPGVGLGQHVGHGIEPPA